MESPAPIETLPIDVAEVITKYLRHCDVVALGGTSKRMRRLLEGDLIKRRMKLDISFDDYARDYVHIIHTNCFWQPVPRMRLLPAYGCVLPAPPMLLSYIHKGKVCLGSNSFHVVSNREVYAVFNAQQCLPIVFDAAAHTITMRLGEKWYVVASDEAIWAVRYEVDAYVFPMQLHVISTTGDGFQLSFSIIGHPSISQGARWSKNTQDNRIIIDDKYDYLPLNEIRADGKGLRIENTVIDPSGCDIIRLVPPNTFYSYNIERIEDSNGLGIYQHDHDNPCAVMDNIKKNQCVIAWHSASNKVFVFMRPQMIIAMLEYHEPSNYLNLIAEFDVPYGCDGDILEVRDTGLYFYDAWMRTKGWFVLAPPPTPSSAAP